MEVWAKVASFLPMRDCAKASGTCRRMRAVRLKTISFPKALPAEGGCELARIGVTTSFVC